MNYSDETDGQTVNRGEADCMEPVHSLEAKHFIEDIGLFFEQMGMPRTAGRILGVLLIADPPAQSITDIAETLMASKSSVSTMARLLAENGLIERVASPVPRRDYYRFKPGGWILYIRRWLGLMSELHGITERGLRLLEEKPPEMRERLQEAHDLFSLVEERFPAIIESLEQGRAAAHPRAAALARRSGPQSQGN
jgi:DNA-binding transcriptional regulator GbsR (MarR family)